MRGGISVLAARFALVSAVVACSALMLVSPARAQVNAAGVLVDADGVLRMKQFQDPTGELTRTRVAEATQRFGKKFAAGGEMRKISLNRLEAQVAELAAKGFQPTDEMKNLAGITRLQYVFFYPESGDVVIAGPAEPYFADVSGRMIGAKTGRAVLQLEDLVVALRAYPPQGQATGVISVSIDPTQEGLQKMRQFLVDISGRVQPGDADAIVHGLRENLGLQKVSVNGISPKTHFAQVLVEADYRMKLIGIGLEKPPVKIASYVDKAKPSDVSRNALQRWFFTPNYECVRVAEDKNAMELVGDGVKLVGENELVQVDGSRVGTGGGNRASEAFCTSFTSKYGELSKVAPVYAQMRNLIDLSVAAAFIHQQDYYALGNWKLDTFGDESKFAVETYETPTNVESACTAVWKGNTLMTPVGGGVRIEANMALADNRLLKDEKNELGSAREKTTLEGVSESQWWWK